MICWFQFWRLCTNGQQTDSKKTVRAAYVPLAKATFLGKILPRFLSKHEYNKMKVFFALRAQRWGTIKGCLSKEGYDKI